MKAIVLNKYGSPDVLVIDYTQENFTQSEQRYDLILDNVGSHTFSDYRRVLTPRGLSSPTRAMPA